MRLSIANVLMLLFSLLSWRKTTRPDVMPELSGGFQPSCCPGRSELLDVEPAKATGRE